MASLLVGQVAVVTGASSGIGRAIAVALSREGVRVWGVGRNSAALAETVSQTQGYCAATGFKCDLTAHSDLATLVQHLEESGNIDILVHSAGAICRDTMNDADVADLDRQYTVNVRVPYLLTQRLLPLLTAARGQVVFINSSAGLAAKRPAIGQYAATKHALKAIADSLREEVNSKGIRVLSLYLGRTATPMQSAIFEDEGREYHPETLMQPEDVASMVVHALNLPSTAEVTDISMRPMRKS